MQIILLKKVANLGQLGDIVKVRDGYARNYLIPQKIARRATSQTIADFEAKRAELEKAQAEKLGAAQAEASENRRKSVGDEDGADDGERGRHQAHADHDPARRGPAEPWAAQQSRPQDPHRERELEPVGRRRNLQRGGRA